jgi:hypothetical protein
MRQRNKLLFRDLLQHCEMLDKRTAIGLCSTLFRFVFFAKAFLQSGKRLLFDLLFNPTICTDKRKFALYHGNVCLLRCLQCMQIMKH